MNQTEPLEDQDPTEVRDKLVDRTGRRERIILAVVLILALWAGVLTYLRVVDQQGRANAEENAVSLADQVRETCERGGAAAEELGDGVCDQAHRVSEEPSEPQPGPAGRGIESTEITTDGMLRVYYTDDTTQLVGRVVGAEGEDGNSIVDGAIADGDLVLTFSSGVSQNLGRVVGEAGADGADGRGITNTAILDGQLVVTYTDGASETLGQVVGSDGQDGTNGQDGAPGAPGRGIDEVSCDPATELWTIRYSDGAVSTFPDCFGNDGTDGTDGTDGEDGRGIQSIECVDGNWRITYTDGSPAAEVGSCAAEPAPQIQEVTIAPGGPPGQDLLIRFDDGSEMRGRVCPVGWGLSEQEVATEVPLETMRVYTCTQLEE
jgi:hypothetical protein